LARGLATAGARVVVAARSGKKSATAVTELTELGRGGALAIPVDVANAGSVTALVQETMRQCGRLDVLVNNAGITIRKAPDRLSLDEWRQVIDTNLTGPYLCSHAAYPSMRAAGGGKIINIGSMLSIFGTGYAPAYAASKGGIVQFTKACASAWAKDNIQVNAILPGWIDTDLTRQAREQVPGLHESVLKRTPAGRWGEIDDFRGIAVFLAGSASDFITGAAITVDGGYSIQG
jgi:2-deoxy-D-gluconate 3-dehydrogenase